MTLIVLTGASSAGKSTLLDALARRGHAVQAEVGRDVVRHQLEIGGNALPWADARAFRDLLFHASVQAFDTATLDRGPVICDRSFIDALAHSLLLGMDIPDEMLAAADTRRFFGTVLICEPWQAIFTTDRERRKSFDTALDEYEATCACYQQLGYALQPVPKLSVAARVDWVETWLRTALAGARGGD